MESGGQFVRVTLVRMRRMCFAGNQMDYMEELQSVPKTYNADKKLCNKLTTSQKVAKFLNIKRYCIPSGHLLQEHFSVEPYIMSFVLKMIS